MVIDVYIIELNMDLVNGGVFGIYQGVFNLFQGICQGIVGVFELLLVGEGYYIVVFNNIVWLYVMFMLGMFYILFIIVFDGN